MVLVVLGATGGRAGRQCRRRSAGSAISGGAGAGLTAADTASRAVAPRPARLCPDAAARRPAVPARSGCRLGRRSCLVGAASGVTAGLSRDRTRQAGGPSLRPATRPRRAGPRGQLASGRSPWPDRAGRAFGGGLVASGRRRRRFAFAASASRRLGAAPSALPMARSGGGTASAWPLAAGPREAGSSRAAAQPCRPDPSGWQRRAAAAPRPLHGGHRKAAGRCATRPAHGQARWRRRFGLAARRWARGSRLEPGRSAAMPTAPERLAAPRRCRAAPRLRPSYGTLTRLAGAALRARASGRDPVRPGLPGCAR
jgi:hypothetical protein